MFVLPNLFTVSSIFLGFYALTLCEGAATPEKLYQAALAIIFAMVFDGCDGRVARMTRTQSEFGMQLDSLADVISFGAAPALLVYKWALAPMGFLGIAIAGFYAICGALRLARFNVLAARGDKGSSRFFVGLPIPLAAGTITALVIAHYKEFGAATDGATRAPVAIITLLLSLLMVSTVRYRTFKDVHLSRRSAAAFLAVVGVGLAVGLITRASFVLVVYMAAYLAMGIAESMVWTAHAVQRVARVAAAHRHGVASELDDDEDGDGESDQGDNDEQDEYI
jgi:CDP-diacylglycerol--serine O-phosphatidyltransferase